MHAILKNLQHKTDAQKSALAVFCAIFVTVFLFIVWGYNFAHSGKLNNIANSAVGVASAIESANVSESISATLNQLERITGPVLSNGVAENMNENQDSVGIRHMNVFVNASDATVKPEEVKQRYGENAGDILY